MRIGVVDIGTNSTRLLVADVVSGRVDELARDSRVTRLGQGVDRNGTLADEAITRVLDVLDDYAAEFDRHGAETTVAVLTSAVRDAANGAAFTALVRDRYGIDARAIPGEQEARLTFLGATSERPPGDGEVAVVDIGGGSTEVVTGCGRDVTFFASLQLGVVRHGERHLHGDPPEADELLALGSEAHALLDQGVPSAVRSRARSLIAVAGTATQSAAIDLRLDTYDPARVHGHVLHRARLEEMLARLAALPLAERRRVAGLDPARAPTIVAGIAILLRCLDAFGVASVEVSEHDILRGAALARAADEWHP